MQVILFHYFQVTSLGLAGGATIKETVWGILRRAIMNDLALKITWSGANQKLAFDRLQLKAVVVGKFNNCIKVLMKHSKVIVDLVSLFMLSYYHF